MAAAKAKLDTSILTERQKKWFASMEANLKPDAEVAPSMLPNESKRLAPVKRLPWARKHTAILLHDSSKELEGEGKGLLELA